MAYDSILETTAVRVVVDDSKLTNALQKATRRVRDAFKRIEKAQGDAAKTGVTATAAQDKALTALQAKVDKLTTKVKAQATTQRDSTKAAREATKAAHEAGRAAERAAKGARENAQAQDGAGDKIKAAARFALTLRREYENSIITTEEFKREADQLRNSLLRQAEAMERGSREYDQAQLGAQRLSTAIATVEGRTSKLGFSANVTTGVVAALTQRLRSAGPAGSAAAMGLTAFTGASGLATRAARSFGRYVGTQLIPILATFAGIAGIGIAVRGLNGFVKASFDAEVAVRLFNRELGEAGRSARDGEAALARVARTFRTTEEDVAGASLTLLRYGATLEQTETLLSRGGASALAFGRDAATGFESVANAIVSEQSQMLNNIGVAGNLSTAYGRMAKELGVSTDALTRQQKVQAALNMILEETQGEYEALDEILSGYGGALSAFRAEQSRTARALGAEFEPAITAAYEAGAQFLTVFREQVLPMLSDRFGPVISGAAESVQGFLDALSDPDADLSGFAQSITDAIGPAVQLAAVFIGLWSGARAAIAGVMGEVAELGAYLGTVSANPGAWLRDLLPGGPGVVDQFLVDQYGEDFARDAGADFDGSVHDQAMAAGAAAKQQYLGTRQGALATGDEALEWFMNPEGKIGETLAAWQNLATDLVTAPPPPARPPGSAGEGGGENGEGSGGDTPDGTERDPLFTRMAFSGMPGAASRGANEAAAAAIRADTDTAMRASGLLTGGPFTGTGIPRPDRGDGGLATVVRAVQSEAAQDRTATRAYFDRLTTSLTAPGTPRPALGVDVDGMLAQEAEEAARAAMLAGFEAQGALLRNGTRAPTDVAPGHSALGVTDLLPGPTSAEAAESRTKVLAYIDQLSASVFAPVTTPRPGLGVDVDAINARRAFEERAADVFGGGPSAVAPDGRHVFNDFTNASGYERAEMGREFQQAVDDAANEQRNAGIDFATQVVNAADGFVSAIEAFRSGNIAGGIGGLGATAGSLFGSIGSLAGLGSAGPIGALIGAGAGLLGGIVGAFTGNNESPAVDSAQSRRMPSAIELRFDFHQTNSLGLLDDPQTTRRLGDLSEEAFRRFEDVIKRNINPRLTALEGRVF